MSIRMHTRSIDNFLCSETVERRSVEYTDTDNVRNFIHLHTRMMKNLEYINTRIVGKPARNKRTLQRRTCKKTKSV